MPAIEESQANVYDCVWVDGPGAPTSDNPGRWVPYWEQPDSVTEMMEAMHELDMAAEWANA